jgi:ribosomal protein L13E
MDFLHGRTGWAVSWIVLGAALSFAAPAFAEESDETQSEAGADVKPAPDEKGKAAAPPAKVQFDEAAAEKYLEGDFPQRVIQPALARTIERLFPTPEEAVQQAREAVQAAMSTIARTGRGFLGDMMEALVSKDKAAFDAASAQLVKAVDSRTGYWDRAIAKFFPDLVQRGRPLARVGVARAYVCSNAFLGRMLGLADGRGKAAKALRRALSRDERRVACTFVRRWAEKRAVDEFEKLIDRVHKAVKGEKLELSADAQKMADQYKRLLERELVVIVGEYRESMGRVRSAAERLAEDLPPPPKKEEANPPEKKE